MTVDNSDRNVELIRAAFGSESIQVSRIEVRAYPDETNYVVYLPALQFSRAVELATDIEGRIQSDGALPTFLVVRKSPVADDADDMTTAPVTGVRDPRVGELIRLVSARSRVSSVEPSLVYVPDARASVATISASRHHLVFGRRGAGKSALLMEARRKVRAEGSLDAWTNVQTLRLEEPQRVFLFILDDILRTVISNRTSVSPSSALALAVTEVRQEVRALLAEDATPPEKAKRIVPKAQRALMQFLELEGARVFVFVDDFYYVPRETQPMVLDMLHGAIRDCDVWLKIASIRHLTNWWQSRPPMGLQSGQDADLIDLDVTLQDPEKASSFLEGILGEYARRVGIPSLSRVFNRPALDRLVLAAGAVPRDYMVLGMSAINRALARPNSKLVGVQDVNQAAGDAASAKIQELEEDMASNSGVAQKTLQSLGLVRSFCLDETSFTYFLIGYRDKETHPREYSLITDLLDSRLVHLVSAGVSDPSQAGIRFEAFMLDLSQFSGSRLKQRINVLDFEDGHFVSRQTRIANVKEVGGTARQLIGILRKAPQFSLERLSSLGAM